MTTIQQLQALWVSVMTYIETGIQASLSDGALTPEQAEGALAGLAEFDATIQGGSAPAIATAYTQYAFADRHRPFAPYGVLVLIADQKITPAEGNEALYKTLPVFDEALAAVVAEGQQ